MVKIEVETNTMSKERLQRLSDTLNEELRKREEVLEKEANEFWKNFEVEYDFKVGLMELEEGYAFRDSDITQAIRIEAKITEESMKEYNEALNNYGSGPSHDEGWKGIMYPVLDNKVLPVTMHGGTCWLNQFKEGYWTSAEKHKQVIKRLEDVEAWLERAKVGDSLKWKERF